MLLSLVCFVFFSTLNYAQVPQHSGISADVVGRNNDIMRIFYNGAFVDGHGWNNEKFHNIIIDPSGNVVIFRRGRNSDGDCATIFGVFKWSGDENTGVVYPTVSLICNYQVQDGNLQVEHIGYTPKGVLMKFRSGKNKAGDGKGDCYSASYVHKMTSGFIMEEVRIKMR